MANNSIDFEISIRDAGSGALRTVSVAAKKADEAIAQITQSASKAEGGLRNMAGASIVLEAGIKSIQTLQGVIGGAISQYNSFDTAMRRANTMALQSGEAYDKMRGQIVSMSREIPLVRDELANGLYEVVSNGVPEDNWIGFLDRSARAAVGGCADLGTTVGTTATIIKTYGLAWDQATSVQDKMQMTAKKGKTSIAELGQALPRVSGSASQLGVELNELMAVFASTTGVTGNTSEVSTQLAAVLNSLIKPTSEASKAAEAMGIRFDAASVKAAGGFANFLTQLDTSVQAYAAKSGQLSETIYGQLFGSAEALRLLGSLTGEQKDVFAANIQAMADSTGTIDEAFEIMNESNDSFAQKLNNAIASMTDWAGSAAKVAGPVLDLTANAGMAVMSIAQLTKGMRLAKVASAAWTAVQHPLNAAISANPIGLVVMAIAALVAAIVYAYNNCEEFRQSCDRMWATIKDVAEVIWALLVKAFNAVYPIIKDVAEVVWSLLVKAFEALYAVHTKIVGVVMDYLAPAFDRLSSAVKTAWKWVRRLSGVDEADQLEAAGNAAKGAAAAVTGYGEAAEEAGKKAEEAGKKTVYGLAGGGPANPPKYDGKSLIANARTYNELANNITYYEGKLKNLAPSQEAEITRTARTVAALKRQQEAIKALQAAAEAPEAPRSMADISKAISVKKAQLQLEPDPGAQVRTNREIEALERQLKVIEIRLEAKPLKADQIIPATPDHGAKIDLSKYGVTPPDLSKIKLPGADQILGDGHGRKKQEIEGLVPVSRLAQQGLGGVADMLGSISRLTDESAGAWLQWGASVLDACSRALPAIMAVAAGNAANSAAQTPVVGWILAGAAIAGVLASFAAIPKFADGGIAYGPTLGLFGEYAGASNNPEVVAPLDKLRSLINPAGGVMAGRVEFVIDGRRLVGVLNNVNRYNERTR
ncbi:phage tail tape measure protein [Paramuribaculum intestinale]|uniref:phage tail tape measure protein n=1 Tax=Paramuribaculum intestinale TaxID=2094151 RepID=UPI0025AEF59A|nr:phage tail tape measure protein [Paramuribaculum intestinale]